MINSSDVDSKLLRKSKLYRIYYITPLTVILVLLIIVAPAISLLYLIAVFLTISILDYVVRKRKGQFNCIKCGLCCALRVEPDEKDIRKIEKNLSKPREQFMEGRYLKRINGYCAFLKNKNGENTCSIYKFRPKICRRWPFKSFRLISLTLCPSLRSLLLRRKND